MGQITQKLKIDGSIVTNSEVGLLANHEYFSSKAEKPVSNGQTARPQEVRIDPHST